MKDKLEFNKGVFIGAMAATAFWLVVVFIAWNSAYNV